MTTKDISVDEMKTKLGASIRKMSPTLKASVLSGAATMAIGGLVYRACSDDDLGLVHKAAPRIATRLEPEPEKRRDLVAEYHAEVAAERASIPDEPTSPAVRAMLAAERASKTVAKRAVPETTQEIRVRLQREADARQAAKNGKRPTKMARLFEGGKPPKDAA